MTGERRQQGERVPGAEMGGDGEQDAGEACERFDSLVLVRGVSGEGQPRTESVVPTYRGERKTFG